MAAPKRIAVELQQWLSADLLRALLKALHAMLMKIHRLSKERV